MSQKGRWPILILAGGSKYLASIACEEAVTENAAAIDVHVPQLPKHTEAHSDYHC